MAHEPSTTARRRRAAARPSRLLAVLLALLLVSPAALLASSTAIGTGAHADPDPDAEPVDRVAGEDRYETAAELAARADGDTLWVATGEAFPDALAAAATGDNPILLVADDHVPEATREAASDLDVERVRVAGGEAVVDEAAAEEVAEAADVDDVARRAGDDRYETAAAIARDQAVQTTEAAYVATGEAFADALTAAVAAAEREAPVLLAAETTAPDATLDALDELAPSEVVVVGGTAAIGEDVAEDLADAAGVAAVERVAGEDRYDTAAAVAEHRGVTDLDGAYLAAGDAFPDALAAAPAATAADDALLLTEPEGLPDPTITELERAEVEEVTLAGGTAAIDDAVAQEVRATLDLPGTEALTVSFLDVGQADATLLDSEDATILVDAGHWQRDDVTDHLEDAGVDALDVLVLTHWHADHIGQVPEVLDAVAVDEVWVQPVEGYDSATYEDARAAIEASDANVAEPRKGDREVVEDLVVDVVGPGEDADTDDVHDANVSVRVSTADQEASVLLTGDAEAPAEARYVEAVPELLEADLYQVGHHGSDTSTTEGLLQAVDPEVAVYSAGEGNTYGHPHESVLDRLEDAGVEVYGTDVHGTVTAQWDGAAWDLATESEGTPRPGEPEDDAAEDDDAADAADCVDLNAASTDHLTDIVHIGEERAQQIVDGRPWGSVDELTEIDGIGEALLDDIQEQGLASTDC